MTLSSLRVPPISDAADDSSLWKALRQVGSQMARERLFALHAEFARKIAARHFRRGRAPDIELQDLRQLAYAGLLEAIERFDPGQGVPFRGYAARRISGSILNGVAKSSEMREQISFRNRIKTERLRSLTAKGLDEAGSADALRALTDLAVALAIGFMLESPSLVSGPSDADPAPSAYESLAWRDQLRHLVEEVARLPDRERLIVRSHYLEGVDFDSLGKLLQISKGRVSQLHKAALGRLRSGLSKDDAFNLHR